MTARRPDEGTTVVVTVDEAQTRGAFWHDGVSSGSSVRKRVLYEARRDFLPRVVGEGAAWRFDRLVWDGHDLPTGELKRTIGHWNLPDQVEAFLCVEGLVYMVVARSPEAPVAIVRVRPGALLCMPGGAWHVTFVESERAVVENTFQDPKEERTRESKYAASRSGAFRLSLLRTPGGAGIVAANHGETPVRFVLADAPVASAPWSAIADVPLTEFMRTDRAEPTPLREGLLAPGEVEALPTSSTD